MRFINRRHFTFRISVEALDFILRNHIEFDFAFALKAPTFLKEAKDHTQVLKAQSIKLLQGKTENLNLNQLFCV